MEMNVWITVILFGALLGALGQGIRAIVGLKKLRDQADATGPAYGEQFSPSRLVVSLVIGSVVGAATAIIIRTQLTNASIGVQTVTTLVAAGYAGTDTIEGLAAKIIGSSSPGSMRAS